MNSKEKSDLDQSMIQEMQYEEKLKEEFYMQKSIIKVMTKLREREHRRRQQGLPIYRHETPLFVEPDMSKSSKSKFSIHDKYSQEAHMAQIREMERKEKEE